MLPPRSYINAEDFDTAEQLAERLTFLAGNKTEYNKVATSLIAAFFFDNCFSVPGVAAGVPGVAGARLLRHPGQPLLQAVPGPQLQLPGEQGLPEYLKLVRQESLQAGNWKGVGLIFKSMF